MKEQEEKLTHAPVYGKNAVTELLKSGAGVDTVFIQDTMQAGQAAYFTAWRKRQARS